MPPSLIGVPRQGVIIVIMHWLPGFLFMRTFLFSAQKKVFFANLKRPFSAGEINHRMLSTPVTRAIHQPLFSIYLIWHHLRSICNVTLEYRIIVPRYFNQFTKVLDSGEQCIEISISAIYSSKFEETCNFL